jgi:YD repeat-containing protein
MATDKDETDLGNTGEEATQETKLGSTQELSDAEIDEQAEEISDELDRLINAEKATLGRTLKSTLEAHTTLKQQYDSQGKRFSELENTLRSIKQKERERELKDAEGTPDLLDSVRLKHQAEDEWEKVTKARSELENEKTLHQTAVDKAIKAEATDLAKELTKESGLAATLLLQIASDTTENGRTTYNLERMKQIAKSVPKGESEEEEAEEGAEKEPAVRGQQSRAAGAGGRTATRGFRTWEDYEDAFIHSNISFEQYREAAKRFNKNI